MLQEESNKDGAEGQPVDGKTKRCRCRPALPDIPEWSVDRSVGWSVGWVFHLSYMLASSWSHISRLMVITIYHPGAGICAYMRICVRNSVTRACVTRVSQEVVVVVERPDVRVLCFSWDTHGNCSHLSRRICGINLPREPERDTNRRFK